MVALSGVQGGRWDWGRQVLELVLALDADAAGQQQGRVLARQAARRGKRVAGVPAAAYGGQKDASAAWAAGVLAVEVWSAAAPADPEELAVPENLREAWAERVAIMATRYPPTAKFTA